MIALLCLFPVRLPFKPKSDSVTHRRAGDKDRCSVLTRLTPWPFAMKTPSQWTGGRNVDISRVPSSGRTKTGVAHCLQSDLEGRPLHNICLQLEAALDLQFGGGFGERCSGDRVAEDVMAPAQCSRW